MANAWLTLAEPHLRNQETVSIFEPLTPVNEPPLSLDQPPQLPPIDEPGTRPPMKDLPPPSEPPPPRLQPAGRDDPARSNHA